jgi:predicted Zn-dependent protease
VSVTLVRAGVTHTVTMTPPPDWTAVPDYARALAVLLRREPDSLPYAYAAVRQLIDAGRAADARTALQAWRPTWRASGMGQLLQGDLLAAAGQQKQALGAYNRALVADAGITAAQFGRGVAFSALDRSAEAADAFTKVIAVDPGDAAATSFQAYVLLKEHQSQGALTAAEQSISTDPAYEDGYLARGLALLAVKRRAEGLRVLKKGLVMLSDSSRAAELIASSLEPNDP